jgi:hypothetical protein
VRDTIQGHRSGAYWSPGELFKVIWPMLWLKSPFEWKYLVDQGCHILNSKGSKMQQDFLVNPTSAMNSDRSLSMDMAWAKSALSAWSGGVCDSNMLSNVVYSRIRRVGYSRISWMLKTKWISLVVLSCKTCISIKLRVECQLGHY